MEINAIENNKEYQWNQKLVFRETKKKKKDTALARLIRQKVKKYTLPILEMKVVTSLESTDIENNFVNKVSNFNETNSLKDKNYLSSLK